MRRFPSRAAMAAFALVAAGIDAATPDDFSLRLVIDERGEARVVDGGSAVEFKARVLLDSHVAGVEGWSFGFILRADPGLAARIVSAFVPRGVTTIANGAPPAVDRLDFFVEDDFSTPACSWTPLGYSSWDCAYYSPILVGMTQTVRISADDLVTLNATEDFTVLELGIRVATPVVTPPEEPAPLAVNVLFTDVLGEPATPTAILHGGLAIAPATQQGAILDGFPLRCHVPMQYTIACEDAIAYEGGRATSLVTLSFDSDPETPHETNAEIQGWAYGLCVDPAVVQVLDATIDDTDTETCRWGLPPAFERVDILPEGVAHSVVVEFKRGREGFFGIEPQNGWRDLRVTYAIADGTEGAVTHVTPCSGVLRVPEWIVSNIMVIWGESRFASSAPGIDPALECCVPAVCNKAARIAVTAFPLILGGNANSDARLDIADGVYLLQYLFAKGPAPRCMDAADFNADGRIDIGDPIAIMTYLFPDPGQPPQPAWHIGCYSFDASATPLGCVAPPPDACAGRGP